MTNHEKYLKLCHWAMRRYTVGGVLIVTRGGAPSAYERIQLAAWNRYIGAFTPEDRK